MGNHERSTGWEDGVSARGSSSLRRVLDFDASKGGTRALGISDRELVDRALRDERAGVVENLQGLRASVGDGRGNLEVLDILDACRACTRRRVNE